MNLEYVDVCIYCEKEVIESDPNYCCLWLSFVDYTGSDNFTCKDFKQMVAGSYKAKNLKKSIKKEDAGYEKPDYGFDLFLEDSIVLK